MVDGPRGPVNCDGVDASGGAEAEVQARIAGGLEAGIGANFGGLSQAGGSDFDPGAEAIAIRALAYRLDTQPMAGRSLIA